MLIHGGFRNTISISSHYSYTTFQNLLGAYAVVKPGKRGVAGAGGSIADCPQTKLFVQHRTSTGLRSRKSKNSILELSESESLITCAYARTRSPSS